MQNENEFELTYLQVCILAQLKVNKATHKMESFTISNLCEKFNKSRSALYKNVVILFSQGYIAKGRKIDNAESFYITKKGLEVKDLQNFNEE